MGIQKNESGSLLVGLIILFILMYGSMYIATSVIPQPDIATQSPTELFSENDQDDNAQVRRANLVAQDGLEGQGTAVVKKLDERFTVEITAALPILEDNGFYEAYIQGPSEVFIGRLQKVGTTWQVAYNTFLDLHFYRDVKVVVDGPRNLQNQTRPLPFTILKGKLQ